MVNPSCSQQVTCAKPHEQGHVFFRMSFLRYISRENLQTQIYKPVYICVRREGRVMITIATIPIYSSSTCLQNKISHRCFLLKTMHINNHTGNNHHHHSALERHSAATAYWWLYTQGLVVYSTAPNTVGVPCIRRQHLRQISPLGESDCGAELDDKERSVTKMYQEMSQRAGTVPKYTPAMLSKLIDVPCIVSTRVQVPRLQFSYCL